jgi:hypothetical protein
MKRSLCCRELVGLLDCANGVSKLHGELRDFGECKTAPLRAGDIPYESESSIVAERIRVSVNNAAGLRKGLCRPFALGLGTIANNELKTLCWKDIFELDEWREIGQLIEPGNLHCVFKELKLYYDVAQIDPFLHMRPISLNIELEISEADG